MLKKVCLSFVLFGIACSAPGDWPQFLGPGRNNASPEKALARSWPAEGPPVVWTHELGPGFAGPAVAGEEVYILDRVPGTQDVLRCLDLKTGGELWTFAYDAPGKFSFNGSRTTPAVDDEYVFIVGPLGDFHCVSRKTHDVVWRKHLLNEFGGKRPNWVVSQSPLLYGDTVIAAPQGSEAGVVAFRRDSGEIAWRTPSLGVMAYASPVLGTIAGVEQVVMLTGKGPGTRVTGMDAKSGKILWTYRDGWQCRIPITSPTFVGDGRIFLTGEYGSGSAMIKVSAVGGTFRVEELYKTQVCGSQIQQPLLWKGHLYMNSNGNKRRDGFLCLALDGTVKWKTGATPNFERGGLILADGLIYALNGTNGTLALIEAAPEAFKLLSQARILQGKQVWGPLALAGGKLLVRDQRQLKCLAVSR